MWSGADESYLAAITAASRVYTWHGTVTDADGSSYSFTAADIVKGSGKISSMVSSSASLDIGTVYTSELTIRLYLEIDRYKLYNGTIDIYCDVDVSGTTYSVPMGTYYISECTQEISCINITAYDYMLQLDDVTVTTDQGQAYPYAWLTYLADLGGVTLATTEEEIQAMPNGTEYMQFTECETELTSMTVREALAYISAALCANARIGRDGYLYIQQYGTDIVDDIAANERYSSSLSDYTTNYTSVTLTVYEESVQEYYAEDTDDGLNYDLGANPFLQYSMESVRLRTCTAIIDSLSTVAYEPYSASIPLRPELDPMDVISFSGNQASDDKGAITSIVYNIGGSMTVKCSGANPKLAAAKSKENKELTSLVSKISSTDWYSYYFENISKLSFSDALLMVASIAVETVKESKLTMMYTCNFGSGSKGRVYFYVYLNDELYKTYHHVFLDGDNVITFHMTFNIVTSQINYIYIYAISEGYSTFTIDGTWNSLLDYTWEQIDELTWEEASTAGTYSDSEPTITIPVGYSQLTVFGKGLAATNAWDGTISCYDTIPEESVISEFDLIGELTDSVTYSLDSPTNDSLSEVAGVDISAYLGELTDSSLLEDNLVYYSMYINEDRVTSDGITADSGYWYGSGEIDDGTEGWLYINDEFDTSSVTSISAVDSGAYWQLSFDSGTTWVGYSDGSWSTDTIMTATQMAAITTEQLSAQGDTVTVKFYLEDGCTVGGISVRGGSL